MPYNIGDLLPLDHEHLQDKRFSFVTDSQEIEATLQYCPNAPALEDVTGILAAVCEGGGDYDEVWSTGYRAPWNLNAIYERIL